MVFFDSTQIALYLSLVLLIAAIGITLTLSTVAVAVVRNRDTRLARDESMRSYYGRIVFHH
jgi:ABC-type nickel/cobalt efflux system permease component RcnA